MKDKYGVPVAAHINDATLGDNIAAQARMFGIRGEHANVMIDAPLAEGDTIEIGKEKLQVIHTPGHTQGGICLYSPDGKFLISGDTLFKGTIGRTDHPEETTRSWLKVSTTSCSTRFPTTLWYCPDMARPLP